MNIRYDFADILDLSILRKQMSHYACKIPELRYQLYLNDFYISIDILQDALNAGSTYHEVSVSMYDLKYESDAITAKFVVIPSQDMRFNELTLIKSLWDFQNNSVCAIFKSRDIPDTIEKLCNLIKLVHKIKSLKAFL